MQDSNTRDLIPDTATQSLAPDQLRMADQIGRWNLGYAIDKLIYEGRLVEQERDIAEREFKRFLLLIALDVKPIAMISPKLDDVWHQLVLFTRRYEAFCLDTVGFFVHHTPETGDDPIPVQAATNLLLSYERLFGPMPDIWFSGMTRELRRYYQVRPLGSKPKLCWSGWTGEDRRTALSPFEF